MNELDILKQKIKKVEEDLDKTQAEENSEKKRITLIDYLAYLRDELKMLEDEQRELGKS